MLESFLAKLGASTRITVGVAVSPIAGVEMIEIDRLTGTIKKYSCRPLDYDFSNREISNFRQFTDALEELFEELHIPKKSNILMSIPNVHFGLINLPLLLTDESVTNAIVSEVEQSYIFKRKEPVVSWSEVYSNIDTENRTLVYTAVQKSVLESIQEAFSEIGCTLVGLENSYDSLLRALYYTGLAQEQMKDDITWNLMIVGQNSYSILSMSGTKVLDYYEEPLPLKSFVDDEIYNAITTSAQITLTGLTANYLFIVSETDLVSAEVLSLKISVESTVRFLECNKYVQNEMLPTSLDILPKLSMKITPEAVGTTVAPFCDFPLKLNMAQEREAGSMGSTGDEAAVPKINIGGLEVELTSSFVRRVALIFVGIVLVPLLILYFSLAQFLIPKEQAKLNSINSDISNVKSQLSVYSTNSQDNTFNLNSTMSKIGKQNKSQIIYYMSLGLGVPNKLWITYYMSNGEGKIDIKGKSSNVESIYVFYKNIKQLVNDSDVKLYKLEIASDSFSDVVQSVSSPRNYQFEITNMTEAELNPPAADSKTKTDAGNKQDANPQAQNATKPAATGFQFNQPPSGNKAAPDANKLPSVPQASPPPAQGTPPPSQPGNDKLPKNLQKIEKF